MLKHKMFDDSLELARAARIEILRMAHEARASHVASSLSVVDILSVLYSGHANTTTKNLFNPDRDIVVLSKGHAAAALYSILALQDFFPIEWLKKYCADGSPIGGHVTSSGVPGVELSTGSLGHGLPYGVGIALSRKRSGIDGQIFVVMSDGECDEGTTWESALIANQFDLTNLTVIIDRNGFQSLAATEDTLRLEPFEAKWRAFGWDARSLDGQSHDELKAALCAKQGAPRVLIAATTKGAGVSFMENQVLWHYRWPNESELLHGLKELGVHDA